MVKGPSSEDEHPHETLANAPTSVQQVPNRPRTIGKYLICEEIGQGGMGRVYRARHATLGQDVAIKVCFAVGERAFRDIMREGRAMARVHDPHVARVLDVGFEDSLGPYLVMELLRGPTLKDLLLREPLSPAKVHTLALDLAFALKAAHAASLIHRDLKPSNVIVEPGARGDCAKVLDFGIVKPMSGSDEHTTSQLIGTPLYMSPEQWRSEKLTPQSDIWSFGVLVFEMVTGQLPFRGSSPWEISVSVNRDNAPRLSERVAHVDPRIESLVLDCLQRDPSARPTAAELVERLSAFSADAASVPTRRAPGGSFGVRVGVALAGLGLVGATAFALHSSAPTVATADPIDTAEAPPTHVDAPATADTEEPAPRELPSAPAAAASAAPSATNAAGSKPAPTRAGRNDGAKPSPPTTPAARESEDEDVLRSKPKKVAPPPDDDPLRKH